MTYTDLADWLENDADRHCIVEERGDRKNLIKVPYDDDFDFLYYQRACNGNNLSRNQAFYYCGFYNKLDGRLYDLQSVLRGKCPELYSGKTIRSIQDEFQTAVRGFIENIVDNNVDNLRSPFFEDASYQQKFDHFREYYVDSEVRQRFLNDGTADDVKFHCDYDCNRFEEAQMIRYLKYPTAAVEEAATEYWQTHQDDMLLKLYMNEHVRDRLEKLEAQEDTRFHRQRNISKAINESGAKSVNVTIQRDGKDFTFKYDAYKLGCNAYMDYHSWDMSAKDRENFRNMFEEGSRFFPQEVTAITYRGKTIYEAEPWGIDEAPDEGESFDMKM